MLWLCVMLPFKSAKLYILLFSMVYILNPYTILGPLALTLLPLAITPFLYRFKYLETESLAFPVLLVLLSLVGVFSSYWHGIGQLVHLKVSISVLIYIFLAYSAFVVAISRSFTFSDLVYVCLIVVFLNSLIILAQVSVPTLRGVVENFLVPSGNVDWTQGFRYRGLASGGGASLSVLIPVSLVLVLHLYAEKYIGLVKLITISSVLVLSMFFIGRTGFVLIPFVFLSFFFFNIRQYFIKVLVIFSVTPTLFFIFGDEIKSFIVGKYGVDFYNYSFGFFLGGLDGLKSEGTFGVILEFLRVMPTTLPEVLIGYGFYGGSDFYPWTDSGYSRMFLSVGYVFGVMFYLSFFMMFRNVIFVKKFLFLTIGLLLLIAETKEPLLFSGYASRLYIMLLVFALLEKNFERYKMRMNKSEFSTSSHRLKVF